MATEPIGFIPIPKTKKDLELAAQAKQFTIDPQTTNFLLTIVVLVLVVIVFMQVRRIPLIA